MKSALIFAIGALGLLALANYWKSGARVKKIEQPVQRFVDHKRAGCAFVTEIKMIELNSATLFELKGLAGIDDDFAERIMENRPYLTKLDLVATRTIPDAAYEAIKHSITAVHAA